jgi:hypothetical protein
VDNTFGTRNRNLGKMARFRNTACQTDLDRHFKVNLYASMGIEFSLEFVYMFKFFLYNSAGTRDVETHSLSAESTPSETSRQLSRRRVRRHPQLFQCRMINLCKCYTNSTSVDAVDSDRNEYMIDRMNAV